MKLLDLDMIFDPDREPGQSGRAAARKPTGRGQLLTWVSPSGLPAAWHFEWDERAADMEVNGQMPRERAEALALHDVLNRMREQGVIP